MNKDDDKKNKQKKTPHNFHVGNKRGEEQKCEQTNKPTKISPSIQTDLLSLKDSMKWKL